MVRSVGARHAHLPGAEQRQRPAWVLDQWPEVGAAPVEEVRLRTPWDGLPGAAARNMGSGILRRLLEKIRFRGVTLFLWMTQTIEWVFGLGPRY